MRTLVWLTLLTLGMTIGPELSAQTRLRSSQVRDWAPRAGTRVRLNQLRHDNHSRVAILDRCGGNPAVAVGVPWSMWVNTDLAGPDGMDWAPGGCPNLTSPPCTGTYLPLRMVWPQAFDPPAACAVARGEW